MNKMNLTNLSIAGFSVRTVKRSFQTLSFICALIIPFEQMVYGAQFSSDKKKTNDVNFFNDSSTGNTGTINQSDTDKNNPDNDLLSSSIPGVTRLSTMADSEGGMVSNAGNFHGAWNASVDPRTGNASFSLTVGSILYNGGNSRRDLVLAYSGGPSAQGADTFGLGPHWGFNVGTEHVSAAEVEGHKTTDIATGDGHRFTMISGRNDLGNTTWRPLHHKLNDVVFSGIPGHWMISKATETREHIADGYALWEQSRDGGRLYFYYDRSGAGDNTRRLTYICGHPLTVHEQQGTRNACINDGLRVTYRGSSVTIHGQQNITLHRGENGGIGNIKAITMPSLSSDGISNSSEKSTIRFRYDDQGRRPWLLSQVSYPTGQSKTFLYNEQSNHPGAQTSGLPIGIHGAHLPVVTEVITVSEGTGSSVPSVLREWYRYGTLNNHGQLHNYMGYQGEGSIVPGRDNLFDRPDDYTYSVSRDNGLTTTTTTYNKYHLPQLVEQRDNRQNNLLAQHAQEYIPLKGTTFAELPGNYSLPVGSGKTLYATTEAGQDNTIAPARVMEATRYDNNGQVLWKQDAWGRITMTQYCPPEGNARCPVMDRRWPQMEKPEKVLMIPAPHSPKGSLPFLMLSAGKREDPEPAVMTVFDYMTLPADKKSNSPVNTAALLKDTAGENFWQVREKTVGTLPLATVADLKPGDKLPELSQGRLSTRTAYRYNTELHTPAYGQLNQLSMVKYKPATPVVNDSALVLAAIPHAATIQDEITVNIHHEISRFAQTRTTTMTVASETATKQHSTLLQGAENGNGIALGTTVYSLNTGDKIASHDSLKEMQTEWQYDHWHRPVKKTVTPATGGRPQTTQFKYIFTAQENAVVKTLPGGQQFKKVFNAHNQVVSTWHRFADQVWKSQEGVTGWIPDTHTTYTETGKPASRTVYHADDRGDDGTPGGTIGLTTTFGYDTLNRLVWKKTPDGIVSFTIRNDPAMQLLNYRVSTAKKEALSALLTVTESNVLGKPVAQYQLPLTAEIKKQNRLLYSPALQNQLQQVLDKRQPATMMQRHNTYGLLPLSGTGGLFAFVKAALKARAWLTRTTWEYDGNGRRIKQVQGNGAVTRWVYQQGDLVATIAPDGRIIHDTFNLHGKKVSRCVQPVGSTVCHVLGTRGFDIQGNMLWQADEYGQRLQYTRDDNGRMLSMKTPATDEAPEGHTFTYEYNALGMIKASVDSRPYVTHRYDPDTWQLTDTSDAISHLHYRYDKNTGALIEVTRSAPRRENGIIPLNGMDYPVSVQALVQDRYLHPVSMTDEIGNKYTSVHDRLGRVLQTKVQLGTVDNTRKTITLPVIETLAVTTYDHFSRPSTITNGQGIQRLFSYDATGKLASTTDTLHGKALLKLSYTHDADTGNILALKREEGRLGAMQRYTYDLQNNLTSLQCRAVNTQVNKNSRGSETSLDLCPRDIDIKGSGLTRPPVITDQKYTFDQWNNIRQVVETVATDKGAMTKTMDYDYAVKGSAEYPEAYNPNRLLSYRIKWQGQAYSTAPATLTYNSSGHIIKDVDGNILHYNAFGRQDRFTNAATGESTTYTYDSVGHQIAKQPFSAQNRPLQSPLYMLYSSNSIVAKAQRDKDHRLHLSAELAGLAHSEDGVITRWYLHNYKGDVLQSYSNESGLLGNNVYSPYGMQYNRQNNQLTGLPKPLQDQSPWWQSHLPGFDGEVNDEATGYQFLGGGYRAYNPVYRQFMAKDSFSPFKKVNGYGFGDNNPIMNTDPTGHAPRWLGYAMGAMGIGMSIIMGVLLPVAGAAIGSGITAVGATVSVVGAVAGTASGSLQIAATKHPQNKTLQKVSNGFGIAGGIAAMAMGEMGMFTGLQGIVNSAGAIARGTSGLLVASGLTGALAGVTGAAASGIGEAMAVDSRLANKSGLQAAVRDLGYISMGLMAVSIASGIGAGIGVGMAKKGAAGVVVPIGDEGMEAAGTGNTGEAAQETPENVAQGEKMKEYNGPHPDFLKLKEKGEFEDRGAFRNYEGEMEALLEKHRDSDLAILKENKNIIERGTQDKLERSALLKREATKLYGKWSLPEDDLNMMHVEIVALYEYEDGRDIFTSISNRINYKYYADANSSL